MLHTAAADVTISAAALCQPLPAPLSWTNLEFSEELWVLCLGGGAGSVGTRTTEPSRGSLKPDLRAHWSISPQRNKAKAAGGEPDDGESIFLPSQRKRAALLTSCKWPCCDTACSQDDKAR